MSDDKATSEELFSQFHKQVLHQFSKEKYDIENRIKERYDRQYEIKLKNLEEQYKIKKEQIENRIQLDYEKKLQNKRIEDEESLKEMEKDLTLQFLKKQEESDMNWKNEIKKLKKQFQESLLQKDEELRQRSLQEQRQTFIDEQSDRAEYENGVKRKYEALMKEYERDMNEMIQKRESELEEERISLKREKSEFEEKVYEKYQELIRQKENDIKDLLSNKERQLLNYDHEKNLKLNAELQRREEERVEKEKSLHSRYEEQVKEIKEIANEKVSKAESEVVRVMKEQSELKKQMSRMEVQMQRTKHNMDLWKMEYHQSTMEKFKGLIFSIELNSKKEMEDFARQQIEDYEHHLLLELKQKDEELKNYEKREKDFKVQLVENQRLRKHKEMTSKTKEEGFRKLQKYKVRIVELWEALEVEMENRFKFIWNCHSFNNFTTDTVLYFKNEIQRLTEKLPLMETIKRREFIKKRIKEMFKSNHQKIDEIKLNELNKELKRLNDILLTNLPNYERKYNEMFTVKGGKKSYLKMMNQENRFFGI